MIERVSTGEPFLDRLLKGGFEKGSTIVIAGPPGSGKTVFSMAFLSKLKPGEKGMRISLNESYNSFLEYASLLGYPCRKLYDEGRLKILDLIPSEKGLFQESLKYILKEVEKEGITKLVIDSFTATMQRIGEESEVRSIIQVVLGNVLRRFGVTTMVIVESPIGTEKLGYGVEEFAADNVITLSKRYFKGRLVRELEIEKARGVGLPFSRWFFTLKGGFRILPKEFMVVKRRRKLKTIRLNKNRYSSGISVLDKLVGGGFVKGSLILLEKSDKVTYRGIMPLVISQAVNFLNQGYFVFMLSHISKSMEEAEESLELLKEYVKPEMVEKRVFIVEAGKEGVQVSVNDVFKDVTGVRGSHYVWMVNWSALEYFVDPAKAYRLLLDALKTSKNRNFIIWIVVSDSDPSKVKLARVASYHLKLENLSGTPFLYGIKPFSSLYGVIPRDIGSADLIEVV
jgi:KaiC/GvpD/RAD55 family RecA-like ATPase